jgi:phage terminase large subunit-like protein
MLVACEKIRAEVYSAATDRDQAGIMFRDVVAMYERSPVLKGALSPSGIQPVYQLTYLPRGSFFKPLSSEKKGKSGIRPFCGLIDEIHEHRDNSVIEMLRAGTKGNQEALIFEITNSGFDRSTVCWDEHEYSIKVADGSVKNDNWFSYVCALDEGDNPFEDEGCWIKANPNIGVSIRYEFVREQVEEARGMPSKESLVRRLHFCEWTDSADTWISFPVWQSVETVLDFDTYADQICFGGLDMSYTTDLTALALVFPKGEGQWDAFVEFWRPKDGLQDAIKRDKVPYDIWADEGFLTLTEGKVIKLEPIARRLDEINTLFDLQTIAYDAYRHRELDDDMADLGFIVPMDEHPQGFRRGGVLRDAYGNTVPDEKGAPTENPLWMPNSVQEFENAIIEGRCRIAINPVLRWNVSATVIRPDPAGTDNKIFDKRRSTGRIDGCVALAMAAGAAQRFKDIDNGPSVYESAEVFM